VVIKLHYRVFLLRKGADNLHEHKVSKLENSARVAELNPKDTLIKAGFKDDMILCDIGAGTGLFSFPATEISNNTVFALEISDSMIDLLETKKAESNTNNLIIKKVKDDKLPLDSNSCEMALMITVLHELENKGFMLNEIKRILKDKGKLMVIEFHKRETPTGPPIDHRISEEFVEEICQRNGFKVKDKFSLGNNFYGIVFES
jgi:ubiquinone/menaquinone biosynthesis C-methylase UbiE